MNSQTKPKWLAATLCAAMLVAATLARGEMSVEELAKLAQNPVGNLISVPFQNNTRPDFGANCQIRAQVQLMFPK